MLCRFSGASVVANFSPHQRTSVGKSPKQPHRHTRTHITTHTYLKSTRARSKLSQHATTLCKDTQTYRYSGRASARVVYHVDVRHADRVPTFCLVWRFAGSCRNNKRRVCVFSFLQCLFWFAGSSWFWYHSWLFRMEPLLDSRYRVPKRTGTPHTHTHIRTINLFSKLGLLRDSV